MREGGRAEAGSGCQADGRMRERRRSMSGMMVSRSVSRRWRCCLSLEIARLMVSGVVPTISASDDRLSFRGNVTALLSSNPYGLANSNSTWMMRLAASWERRTTYCSSSACNYLATSRRSLLENVWSVSRRLANSSLLINATVEFVNDFTAPEYAGNEARLSPMSNSPPASTICIVRSSCSIPTFFVTVAQPSQSPWRPITGSPSLMICCPARYLVWITGVALEHPEPLATVGNGQWGCSRQAAHWANCVPRGIVFEPFIPPFMGRSWAHTHPTPSSDRPAAGCPEHSNTVHKDNDCSGRWLCITMSLRSIVNPI